MGGWAGEDKGGEMGAANTLRGYSQSCRRGLGGPGNRNVVCFSGLHISPTETSETVRGRRLGRCGMSSICRLCGVAGCQAHNTALHHPSGEAGPQLHRLNRRT